MTAKRKNSECLVLLQPPGMDVLLHDGSMLRLLFGPRFRRPKLA